MKLILPFPPSMNTYWRTMVIRGAKPRAVTHISNDGREFTSKVSQTIGVSRDPLRGRLRVEIVLYQPNRRAIDIDNRIKPLLDAITKAGVWVDDEQIDQLTVSRGPISRENSRCEVTIDVLPANVKELFE